MIASKGKAIRFLCISLSGLLITQCRTTFTAGTPNALSSPVPNLPVTPDESTFLTRQFDPLDRFFDAVAYPEEIMGHNPDDIVPMRCSPEYFSWSGAEHEYFDPSTRERREISDLQLPSYLGAAQELYTESTIVPISYCQIENGSSLVIFGVGPCGGGCAVIPHIAMNRPNGSLGLLTTIEPDGDGPYYGCRPLQLTASGVLYLACFGEGTGIIRRLDLESRSVSVILRCYIAESKIRCGSN
jgi:hypothetical protein